MAQILVIDDQDRTLRLCQRAIPDHEYHGPARTWDEARAALRRLGDRLDLVLLDVHFDLEAEDLLGVPEDADERAIEAARRRQGMLILERLRQLHPDLPVVLMTSRQDVGLEETAQRHAVEEYTYFLDNEYIDANALRAQIESIARSRRGLEREGPIFWGRGMAMRRLRAQLLTLARGRLPIVLGGPTGTGKSLLARHFVHPNSGRKGNFVAVDLATLPKDLMSAQLFGSTRGSYTGSVADRRGAFEEADGGTLFLDEIGNLSEDAQKMLLTVLQEGAVVRLGDVKERKVDVKLVAATNEDLPAMVREGRFRADLYMRLNPACTLRLPPLRERLSDLDELVEFCCEAALAGPYLQELLAEYQRIHGLDGAQVRLAPAEGVPESRQGALWLLLPRAAMSQLRRYSWPGNLRELAMVIENALVFTFAELVQVRGGQGADVVQIRPKILADLLRDEPGSPELEGMRVEVLLRPADALNHVAAEVERQYFTLLYVQNDGDFAAMAQVLMGDAEHARKVQLRFNQLGLKVRELRGRLR